MVLLLVAWPQRNFAGPAATNYERACAALTTARTGETERLHQLFKLDWEHSLIESPEFATEVGFRGQNRLGSVPASVRETQDDHIT